MRKTCMKFISVILIIAMVISAAAPSAFAATILSKTDREEYRIFACDEIVRIAREQIGFYESNINKFTTWYYGYETDAYWCSIFVSWCADQVGAIGTAVPKRSACSSMKNWFDLRGLYYPVNSDYVPQKGDIVFINTEVDGTDTIHHVEIITESGFFGDEENLMIKCIGGNTSDLDYNGSEYVTEKTRPVDGSRAQIVGYAHPSYEKSMGLRGSFYTFSEKNRLPSSKYIQSKFISFIYTLEVLWDNFTTSIELSVQKSSENFRNSCAEIDARFNSLKSENNDSEEAPLEETTVLQEETTVPTEEISFPEETTQPE